MTVADYPDFQTPQANATAISTTGAPLLTLSTVLVNANQYVIAGGGTSIPTILTFGQPGYEIFIQLSIPAGATIPFADVDLTWSDAGGANTVGEEKWILAAGSAASYTYTGTGPTKGSRLSFKITNLDPAQTLTATVSFLVNSRIYRRDRWIPNTIQVVPTFTNAGGDPRREVLALIDALSVGNGVTITRLLPAYHGDVLLYWDSLGVALANSNASLTPVPSGVFGAAALWSGETANGVGQGQAVLLRLPRSPTVFKYTNSGTVSVTLNMRMILLDDKV